MHGSSINETTDTWKCGWQNHTQWSLSLCISKDSDVTNQQLTKCSAVISYARKNRSAMGQYMVSLNRMGKPMIQLGHKYKENVPGNIIVLNHLHTFSKVSPWLDGSLLTSIFQRLFLITIKKPKPCLSHWIQTK